MITKIVTCLSAATLLGACSTAPNATTANAGHRPTMEQRLMAQTQAVPTSVGEPAPPAEGPEDVPANGSIDPTHNPGLLPSPLLRQSAAGGL